MQKHIYKLRIIFREEHFYSDLLGSYESVCELGWGWRSVCRAKYLHSSSSEVKETFNLLKYDKNSNKGHSKTHHSSLLWPSSTPLEFFRFRGFSRPGKTAIIDTCSNFQFFLYKSVHSLPIHGHNQTFFIISPTKKHKNQHEGT